jgi:hypothetical protein
VSEKVSTELDIDSLMDIVYKKALVAISEGLERQMCLGNAFQVATLAEALKHLFEASGKMKIRY